MADQFMRIGGRSDKGLAKALRTDDAGNLGTHQAGANAQEFFSGSGNKIHTFSKEMTGFVISNEGNSSLFVNINGFEFEVKAGEVFEESFYPFLAVQITANGEYRAYGKGYGGQAFGESEHRFFPRGVTGALSGTGDYKRSGFDMKANRYLRYVGASGTPTSFRLLPFDKNTATLDNTAISSGDFTETDADGYAIARVSGDITLRMGVSYVLEVFYGASATASYIRTIENGGTMLGNDDLIMYANSYGNGTAQQMATGSTLGKSFIYDFKIGVETIGMD